MFDRAKRDEEERSRAGAKWGAARLEEIQRKATGTWHGNHLRLHLTKKEKEIEYTAN